MYNNQLKITNSELAIVESFQKIIQEIQIKKYENLQEPIDFYTNLITVTKFAIARQFDKDKTLEMWRKWVKWYEEFKPNKISCSEPIIGKVHQSGKYRFCGVDKSGCPILVIRMRYHVKGLATVEQNLRYLIYMIQKGKRLSEQAKTYQLAVIYDRRGMADSDEVSSESMKKFMPVLNDFYPQTLKSFYVLGANIFYRAMWKIVSVFLSAKTVNKIKILAEVQNLTQFIDKQNLDEQYGGKLKIEDIGKIIPINQKQQMNNHKVMTVDQFMKN